MKKIRLKTKDHEILIGKNVLNDLSREINKKCTQCKKIAIVADKKIPKKFVVKVQKVLKKYDITLINISPSEKIKSFEQTNLLLNKLFESRFNRSDVIIGMGGGITGDLVGFVASIFKRGINFINIPTTLLAQVDSCIGGKTGVNSNFGKNLIGSFYKPRLVITDITLLSSLSKREMICGYAEILKHAIIKDKSFFNWLKINTKDILSLKESVLIRAIQKSCKIKLIFTEQDFKENKERMTLNFGHTFAHAIEVKNNYSKNITHGEAVLAGMILATKLSVIKKVSNINTLRDLIEIYTSNNLEYSFNKYKKIKEINKLIPYLKNDKKNNDEKINFLLLNKIGKTELPNKFKISTKNLEKFSKVIAQY